MPIKNSKHGLSFKYVEPVNSFDCEFNDVEFIEPFVKIQKKVYIGSNSTILPVTIVENMIIETGSVVTKDIIEPSIYFGNQVHKKSYFKLNVL